MPTIDLPWPPSVNNYWRTVVRAGRPRVLLTEEAEAYRVDVQAIVLIGGYKPMAGPLEAIIRLYPPDRRKRDTDNLQKALFDSLEKAGLFRESDNQITKFSVERLDPAPPGRVVVTVQPYSPGLYGE